MHMLRAREYVLGVLWHRDRPAVAEHNDIITNSAGGVGDLLDVADAIVGYSGLEPRGSDVLPRSIVTLPESRQAGPGRKLTQLTVARTSATADICLATTGAACFFETSGFETVSGSDLPLAVTATRQLPGLCRASATAVKLTRPPPNHGTRR